ncbi:hypothetical protein Bca101_064443 [Brassica carinata]
MVLIFHLDMYVVCSIKVHLSNLQYADFSDFKDFWDDLPVSRLKYNTPDDFKEVFQTTSRKSSRRLPGSLPDDFL